MTMLKHMTYAGMPSMVEAVCKGKFDLLVLSC